MSAKTDATQLTVICPNLNCGRTVIVPASSRGKAVRCAFCSTPFRVPGPPQSEASPPTNTRAGG